MPVLFLFFILMPIVEMWVLIEVGSRIGAMSTIALVCLTAFVGLALLRQQGLSTLLRVNQRMEQGQLPATEILEGVLLAVGGALLLTPGFITDTIGFLCLLPPTRRYFIRSLLAKGMFTVATGAGFQAAQGQSSSQFSQATIDSEGHTIIEGEFHREDRQD
jgi:UPF0716 protein FxsA